MSKASRVPWTNSRCPYHLIKEEDQRITKIFPKVRQVCLNFVPSPVGKSSSFHEEEEKPDDPVLKWSAQKQQIARLKQKKQIFQLMIVTNEVKNEIQVVFLPHSKVWMSISAAENVINECSLNPFGHIFS